MQVGKAINAMRSWWRQSIWRELWWEAWECAGLGAMCVTLIVVSPALLAQLFDADWLYWLLIITIPAGLIIDGHIS